MGLESNCGVALASRPIHNLDPPMKQDVGQVAAAPPDNQLPAAVPRAVVLLGVAVVDVLLVDV